MQAIDERHIVTNSVGHRREEVAGLNHDVDRLIGVAEHRDVVALRDAAGQTHTIARDRITKQEPLPASLMPEGLLAGLTDQEIRDFLAYIRSTTPPF